MLSAKSSKKNSLHRTFHWLLLNSLGATLTNAFVWFALTFWVFLETQSVLATSIIAGVFAVFNASSAFVFGSIVDKHHKKAVMLASTVGSLIAFIGGLVFLLATPVSFFATVGSWQLWVLVLLLVCGSVLGNLRAIALNTCVSLFYEAEDRAKANGLVGAMNGMSFSLTSIGSGLAIGFLGMQAALVIAVILTLLVLIQLCFISIPEKGILHTVHLPGIDLRGTVTMMRSIPGLLGLVFFTTFNNFLGGVFMALMDAYGLSLVTVQQWGLMWGVLSLAFIAGGILISRIGLGKYPLKTLFTINTITWIVCMLFTIQASIILLIIGLLIWMICVPFVEATEQTIIQRVVPLERQGRVFGVAQSIESAASPITTFLIGPIAQLFFIPFMTTGAGVDLIGSWFGVGLNRGIALVFILAGAIGFTVTQFARRSHSYTQLSALYATSEKK